MSQPAVHILLLRHGQTDANAQGIMQGQMQTPLNDLGRQQAQMLARGVTNQHLPVVRIVCSDLMRAMQTAEPVSQALGLPVEVLAEWRERCFGVMEGQTANHADTWRLASGELNPPGCEPMPDFLGRICNAMNHLAESGLNHRRHMQADPPLASTSHRPIPSTCNYASPANPVAKLQAACMPLSEVTANQDLPAEPAIAVITHGGCIRAVLRLLIEGRLPLPADMERPPLVPIANCSIMHLRVMPATIGSPMPYQWELVRLNDVAHLGEQSTLTDAG